jgi:hypothetical protein
LGVEVSLAFLTGAIGVLESNRGNDGTNGALSRRRFNFIAIFTLVISTRDCDLRGEEIEGNLLETYRFVVRLPFCKCKIENLLPLDIVQV